MNMLSDYLQGENGATAIVGALVLVAVALERLGARIRRLRRERDSERPARDDDSEPPTPRQGRGNRR